MPYREHLPHPALRPYVDRFWTQVPAVVEAPNTGPHRILPDGCIDVLLNLTTGRAVVVGTMTRALAIASGPGALIAAVRFRPGGARPLLGIPAQLLTDLQIACIDLGLRDLVVPRLGPVPTREGRAAAARALADLERSLLHRLADAARPDPLIDHATRCLLGPQAPSIERLAQRLGWSRQHLRRAFVGHVGVGPKQFDRVARLQRTVAALQIGPRRSLAEIAAATGYFDQAHMAGDFRTLVGVTPQVVRAQAGSIFPIQSLLDGT
jgi:AraC-like DNA-binding protein